MNDNNDAHRVDWNGFQFSELDNEVEKIIQYFPYIRCGAQHIAAASDGPEASPLRFINSSGGFVVG